MQLLSGCFTNFIAEGSPSIEPKMAAYEDPAERAIRRLAADRRGDELGSMLAAAIRSEGRLHEVDQHPLADAMGVVMSGLAAEIGSVRPSDSPDPPVSDELLTYGLLGALSFQSMRASWGGGGLGTADFLRARLFHYPAILAAVRGEVDIYGRLARYEDMIKEASTSGARSFADSEK